MAKQGIFTGSSPNDGTGDSLALGAIKVNQNFDEVYSTFGDGNNLISYVNTAGVATVAGNLTGDPSISVTKVVGAMTSSIIPFLWSDYADLPPTGTSHGAVAHVHETGKLYYAHGRWIEVVNMEADRTVGTGTENYNVGVVTANFFYGDGSNLTNLPGGGGIGTNGSVNTTGIITASAFVGDGSGLTGLTAVGSGVGIQEEGSNVGTALTINFIGAGVTATYSSGTANIEITAGGGGISSETDPIFTSSVAFGIGAGDTANWTTAYGWGDHASAGYATTSYVDTAVTGLASEGYVDTAVAGVNTFTGAATTITPTQIGNWDTAYSWGDHSTAGYITTSLTINGLADVNAGAPTTGHVLKWSGTQWIAAADQTAAGAGIGLSDLSVTITSAGINSLTYNNVTGVFEFTPTDVSGFSTTGYVDNLVAISTFSGDYNDLTNQPSIPSIAGLASEGYVDNAVSAKADLSGATFTGNVNFAGIVTVSPGILTATTLRGLNTKTYGVLEVDGVSWLDGGAEFGPRSFNKGYASISTTGIATFAAVEVSGVVTATSFVGDGSALTGVTSYTNSDVDSHLNTGTASAGEVLSWTGSDYDWVAQSGGGAIAGIDTTGTSFFNQINASGIVTASRFESSSAGTPTIDSPNNVNINAVTVAISTNLTVGTSVVAAGQTINATGVQVTGVVTATSFSGDGSGLTGISVSESDTLATVTARGNTTTAEITAANFRTNDTVGDGSDVGFAIKYYVTANGFTSYRFAGPGLVNTTDNPTIYVQRGFTYIFENSTGSAHPFRIQFTGTTTGVGTYVSGSQNGTQVFTIPMDAPSSYQYQCTLHAGMVGSLTVA